MHLRTVAAATTMLFPLSASAQLIGISWTGQAGQIDPATGAYTALGASGMVHPNSMGRDSAGRIYSADGSKLYRLDPTTGTATYLTNLAIDDIRAIAFSPSDDLYAILNRSLPDGTRLPDDLYRVNLTSPTATLVGSTGMIGMQGMDFSPAGVLYAWEVGTGTEQGRGLVRIDPLTATVTDVNPAVGGWASDVQTLAFAPDGTLYGARNHLFSIDLTTGIPTAIGSATLPDIRGMEFIVPEPAAVSLLSFVLLLRRRVA